MTSMLLDRRSPPGRPSQGDPADSLPPPSILVEEGDRVQLLDRPYLEGVIDRWLVVQEVSGSAITVTDGNGFVASSPLLCVVAHRKSPNPRRSAPWWSTVLFLQRAVRYLVARRAPAQCLHFWESKLRHARRLYAEIGGDGEAGTRPSGADRVS